MNRLNLFFRKNSNLIHTLLTIIQIGMMIVFEFWI